MISFFIIPKSSEEYVKDGGNETTNHHKNLENVEADRLRADYKFLKPKDCRWFLAKFLVTFHFFWNLLLNFQCLDYSLLGWGFWATNGKTLKTLAWFLIWFFLIALADRPLELHSFVFQWRHAKHEQPLALGDILDQDTYIYSVIQVWNLLFLVATSAL